MKTMTFDQVKEMYETYLRIRETPDTEYVLEETIYEESIGHEGKD